MEAKTKIYKEVIRLGCCKRCGMRYAGDKFFNTFEDPDNCLRAFGYINDEPTFELPTKRRKENPCVVCLGFLQDDTIDSMLSHKDLNELNQYDHESVVFCVNSPLCMAIREISMQIYLSEKFPNLFDRSEVVKIHAACRHSIENNFEQRFKKKLNRKSKLTVSFVFEYSLEEEETAVIEKIYQGDRNRNKLNKNDKSGCLYATDEEVLKKYISIPPRRPMDEVVLSKVDYYAESTFLIGSYCKYSRLLFLKPFVNNNRQVVFDYSIQSIISDGVKSVLGPYKTSLHVAGGEDKATRVFGTGRIFYLSIANPKISKITPEHLRQIEEHINKSKVLEVKNLREARRKDCIYLAEKQKLESISYKLLVIVFNARNIDHCVNAINMYDTIRVQQKTAIRQMTFTERILYKDKIIYKIKAKKVEGRDNLIEVDMVTRSALALREFVHGDLGRTRPSISALIKAEADLLAVDVMDFVPSIQSE